MAKKDDKEVMTVVAELRITSPLGEETIRSFDKAWTRFRELPMRQLPRRDCLELLY